MKNSIKLLISAVFISSVSFSSASASMLGSFYITASGGILQQKHATKLLSIYTKKGGIGFFGVGYNFHENLRVDGTIFIAKPNYKKASAGSEQYEKNLYPKIWGGMLTAYGNFKLSDFVEISAGPSIGYSNIDAEIKYKDIINDISKSGISELKKKNNLAIGFSSGIGLSVFDTCTIDLHYRYINFGKTSKKFEDKNFELDKAYSIKTHAITVGIRKDL